MLCLYGSGCGQETGIVIEVTGDEAVTAQIAQLEFFVGLEDAETNLPGTLPSFAREQKPEDVVAIELDRNLAAAPFRLLLRPEDFDSAGGLTVGVVARDATGGELAAAMLPQPVAFVSDTVLEFDLALVAGGSAPVSNPKCLRVGDVVIATADDRDCDAFPVAQDCNDRDPRVHPDQLERCDGVDTNCDGERFPPRLPCFGVDEDNCFLGERSCDDRNPANPGPTECTPFAVTSPLPDEPQLCEVFTTCEQQVGPDGFECTLETGGVVDEISLHGCELRHHGEGVCPGAAVELKSLAPDVGCLWSLVGGGRHGALGTALIDRQGIETEQSTECDAGFLVREVEGAVEPERIYVFGQLGNQSTLVRFDIRPVLVGADEAACGVDEPALSCPGLAPFAVAN